MGGAILLVRFMFKNPEFNADLDESYGFILPYSVVFKETEQF